MAEERGSGAAPPARSATLRDQLREALVCGPRTALELSQELRIPEREVAAHLEHLARSLRGGPLCLRTLPPRCLGCGFVFEERGRASRPSRCPECRSERISRPRFEVVPA